MKKKLSRTLFLTCISFAAWSQVVYQSDALIIHQLTPSVFVHETFLQSEEYGKVSCNGMLVVNGGEAAIFDTPSEAIVADELIAWIEGRMKAIIIAVVVNHHHIDCLGSLSVFHNKGIASYATRLEARLAIEDGYEEPTVAFEKIQLLTIGKLTIENHFLGAAHSSGNIASYVQEEQVIFGGCMVKAVKAGKGNLGDADVKAWPKTMKKLKDTYPKAQFVIPGHGKTGGTELIDYTIELFTN